MLTNLFESGSITYHLLGAQLLPSPGCCKGSLTGLLSSTLAPLTIFSQLCSQREFFKTKVKSWHSSAQNPPVVPYSGLQGPRLPHPYHHCIIHCSSPIHSTPGTLVNTLVLGPLPWLLSLPGALFPETD